EVSTVKDTARNTPAPALAPGRYAVTAGYTSQVWDVTAQGVTRTTAQSGTYAPSPLAPLTHAEAAQVLAQAAAYLGRPAAQPLAPQPVSTPSGAPVGKATGRALHVELSRLGYREHYTAAADALGRPVPSLAALTAAEVKTVYAYAYGSLGMTA
ncbi:hypothetical protein, partial [Deinococcus radiodurans]|uniref:hypothetical protein n=1 Tax=Deinococcus radiodurans TaxID=1299 RepID=UPI0039EAB0CB